MWAKHVDCQLWDAVLKTAKAFEGQLRFKLHHWFFDAAFSSDLQVSYRACLLAAQCLPNGWGGLDLLPTQSRRTTSRSSLITGAAANGNHVMSNRGMNSFSTTTPTSFVVSAHGHQMLTQWCSSAWWPECKSDLEFNARFNNWNGSGMGDMSELVFQHAFLACRIEIHSNDQMFTLMSDKDKWVSSSVFGCTFLYLLSVADNLTIWKSEYMK